MIRIGVGFEESGILPYDLRRLIETIINQKGSGFDMNDEVSLDFIHEYEKTTIVIMPVTTYSTRYEKLDSILIAFQ